MIFKSVLKQLSIFDDQECYVKVFAKRMYGHLLTQHEETRMEGTDLIKEADKMQMMYPFWSERKLSLFVPVMTIDETLLEGF